MNVWKPIALAAVAGLGLTVVVPFARAEQNVCHNQPHMEAALHLLEQARAQLDVAEHNKDGWRVNAIKGADSALAETRRGCAWDDHAHH